MGELFSCCEDVGYGLYALQSLMALFVENMSALLDITSAVVKLTNRFSFHDLLAL